jgi:hypothetical protein
MELLLGSDVKSLPTRLQVVAFFKGLKEGCKSWIWLQQDEKGETSVVSLQLMFHERVLVGVGPCIELSVEKNV